MAYLGNLIVTGASRFLQKIYCSDIEVAGNATFSAVTASSLTSTGTLSVTGAATLSSTLGVTGATTLSSTLKVNGASTLAAVTASGAVTLSSTLSVAGTATFSKTQDLSGTANNSPALIIGGAATSTHIQMDPNEIQAKTNGTSVADLYINTDGGTVFLSNGSKISAKDGLLVTNNLNVVDTLRSSKWDLQSVSQLGGSFYISPTILFPSVTTTAAQLVVAKSNNVLTLTITDPSITSTTIAGSVWTANSKVKVFANINSVTTGTMNGTVTSINTSSHTMTLSVSGGNAAGVTAGTYASTAYKDMSVMLYERRDTVNNTNVDYKVGIWMNCYDVINNSATIRIYSGTAAQPTTFLGNMTSANLPLVNNETPTGYGLFSDNVYLQGKIVANGGKIANWTIGTKGLYYTSDAPSSTSVTLIPDGTTASSTAIGGSSGSKSWVFTVKNIFGVDTSGNMFCSGGKIGGWTVGTSVLSNGTYGSDNSTFISTADMASKAIAGTTLATWRLTIGSHFGVTKTGAIYANSGAIGGWTIGTNVLSNGTYGSDNSTFISTADMASKAIAGSTLATWRLTVGSHFGVTKTGAVYANSGVIGGWTLGTNALSIGTYGSDSSTYLSNTNMASKAIGGRTGADWRFTIGSHFGVTNTGAVYADSVHLTGEITATSGTIGGCTISDGTLQIAAANITDTLSASQINVSSLSSLSANLGTITAGSITIGTNAFSVTSAGVLSATGASISGTLSAGAGSTIGPWTISATSIWKTNATMGNSTAGAAYFGNDGLSITDKFKVTAAGALTATGADITGAIKATSGRIGSNSTAANNWQIGDRMIYYSSSTPGNSASTLVISTGTASTKSIGGSDTTSKNWMIAAGTGFGVTSAGVLYATGANISGTITATAGSIGSFTLTDSTSNTGTTASGGHCYVNSLYGHSADENYEYEVGLRTSSDPTYSAFYVKQVATGGSWADSTFNFYVRADGKLYATNADIKGKITGTEGKIGPWNITETSIYKTNSTMGSSATGAAYFGNDGLSITNKFKVSSAGKLEATGADISGSITASSGDIGGWTISTTSNQNATTANGGHYYKNSIYNQTFDNTYEYEVGMRARGDQTNMTPQDHAFYVRKMNKNAKWSTSDRVFSVSFEGKVITGDITVDNISAHTSGNISIVQDASTAARFSIKCGTIREGRWQLNTDGNMGLFDVTNNSWIIRSATNQTVYVPHNFDVTGTLNVSSTIDSGNISITTSSSAAARLGLKCTSVREARLQINTNKQTGIYDVTNSSWIISSDASQEVSIPHTFSTQILTGYGWDGTTARRFVQSSNQDGNYIGYISSNASTLGFRGQWGTAGGSFSNRTISCPSSDIRLKENVTDSYINALSILDQIKIRAFDWKSEQLGHQNIGFVADEMEQIDPKFAIGGGYDEDGAMNTKSVDTFYLQGYEVKAIQQLHEIIKQQQQRISALQQKLRDKEN